MDRETQTTAGNDRLELPAIDLRKDTILLDIDGTLLDIAPTPGEVFVPEDLYRSLRLIAGKIDGALALVSGRTLASIDELFAPLRTAAIGCHGAQLRRSPAAGAELRMSPIPETLRQACRDIPSLEPLVRIEDKTFTLAFHYRQSPDRGETLLGLLRERVAPFRSDFVLMGGKSVYEIKSKFFNKGEALRALMLLPPFAGRRPVFFGDDTTDEFAFAVLPELGGFGVSVGRPMPYADFTVSGPDDVRRWLAILADGSEGANSE